LSYRHLVLRQALITVYAAIGSKLLARKEYKPQRSM
jgi:hypothetical protein